MEEFLKQLQSLGQQHLQSPFASMMAGLGSSFVDFPKNMWNLYSENVGQPFADFALTPESEYYAPPGEGSAVPTWMYGLPGSQDNARQPFSFSLGSQGALPELSLPGGPDFSEATRWWEQAKPAERSEGDSQKALISDWLAGLSSGVGSINASEEGVGALLGALAGGGGAGLARGRDKQQELAERDRQSQQQYALGRAGFAADTAESRAAYAAQAAKARYANEMAKYSAGQAKVLEANSDGFLVQSGSNVTFIPNSAAGKQYDDLETVVSALGGDHPVAQQLKYDAMFSDPNVSAEVINQTIIKDIVASGQGPAIFGESYNEALELAMDQVPAGIIGEDALPIVNNLISNLLLQSAIEQGNFDWLAMAAQLGNYGAMRLQQSTQPTNMGLNFGSYFE